MVTKTQQLLKFVCSAWVQYSQLCALTRSRGHADTFKSNHTMSTTGTAAAAPVIKIHPDTNNPIKAWDKLKVRSYIYITFTVRLYNVYRTTEGEGAWHLIRMTLDWDERCLIKWQMVKRHLIKCRQIRWQLRNTVLDYHFHLCVCVCERERERERERECVCVCVRERVCVCLWDCVYVCIHACIWVCQCLLHDL